MIHVEGLRPHALYQPGEAHDRVECAGMKTIGHGRREHSTVLVATRRFLRVLTEFNTILHWSALTWASFECTLANTAIESITPMPTSLGGRQLHSIATSFHHLRRAAASRASASSWAFFTISFAADLPAAREMILMLLLSSLAPFNTCNRT